MISAPKHLWYGWVRQKSCDGNKEGKDVPKITQMYLKSPSKAVAILRMDPAPKPGLSTLLTCTCHPLISGTFRGEIKCNTEIKHMGLVSHLFITSLCTKCLLQCQGLLFSSICTISPLLSPLTPEPHDPTMKKWF